MKTNQTKSNQKKMGRKSKLTTELTQKIVEAIKMGCTFKLACQYAGIDTSTFYLWMQSGREGKDKTKIDFFNSIKKAEAECAFSTLKKINEASTEDWRAGAWLLERRHQYIKNPPADKEESHHQQIPSTTKDLLKHQQQELMKASKQALDVGSFQAYAALQRQILNVTIQLKALEVDIDEADQMNDQQLIQTITDTILSLPPVLQEQIRHDIIKQRNKIVEIDD